MNGERLPKNSAASIPSPGEKASIPPAILARMQVKWNAPKYLRQDEARRFFSAIKSARDRALFLTIYLYGLRVSEACLLQRDDIDFRRRTIRSGG